MTEVHAFRDAAALQATDLIGSAANALVQPPPVPAPPGLVAADGTRLVAGLTWEIAAGPEAPVMGANAPHVLRLPDRRARLADAADGPCGSLLLAMAADLTTVHFPGASGPWAFIAELPEAEGPPALWMAIADIAAPGEEGDGPAAGEGVSGYVTPRPGPERIFDDPDDALAALQEHLDITDIAGLAVRWLPGRETRRGRMIMGIAEIAETLDLHDVGPETPAPAGLDREATSATVLPGFSPPRQVPVRLLGGLGAVAAAFLAAVFVVLPAIEEALRPPPPPPVETVSAQVAPGAFASACTAALEAWWPRITGWQVAGTGCAMAGHLPDDPALPEPGSAGLTVLPMAVWRQLVPEPGRNRVLARSAADQMIATWPHEARIDANGLTLWRTESLPLVPREAGETEARPDPTETRARLAALWADAPDAVTRPGDSGLIAIRTTGATPTGAMLARAARVPGIAPVRLVRSADGATLVLAPVSSREVPATLFEPVDGGSSP